LLRWRIAARWREARHRNERVWSLQVCAGTGPASWRAPRAGRRASQRARASRRARSTACTSGARCRCRAWAACARSAWASRAARPRAPAVPERDATVDCRSSLRDVYCKRALANTAWLVLLRLVRSSGRHDWIFCGRWCMRAVRSGAREGMWTCVLGGLLVPPCKRLNMVRTASNSFHWLVVTG